MRIILSTFLLFTASLLTQAQSDTVFYRRVFDEGAWHTIYREPDSLSSRYDELAFFDIEFMDRDVYDAEKAALLESQIYPQHHALEGIPKYWVGLFRYEEQWVAYYPCNFLWHYKVIINDTEYIDWTGEGPQVNYLREARQIDDNTWEFKMKGNYRENDTILIHLIDREKGIAIFEEDGTAGKVYYPMITSSTIHQVPLIVNDCPNVLQDEFEFGITDFSVFVK